MKIDLGLTRVSAGTAADRVDRQQVRDAESTAQEQGARTANADAAVLSPRAQDVRLAQGLLAQVPEIRQDRVDEIRARIEAGTYGVDAELVAGRVLEGEQ